MASTATVTPAPRLAPHARHRGLLSLLISIYMRLAFGKVMSVVRIMYARLPGMAWGSSLLELFAVRGLTLEPHIRNLIDMRISHRNGCTFCADLAGARIVMAGERDVPEEDLTADPDDARFDARTRAALRYVDELGRDHTVSDATFDELSRHFDDRQVAEIVWLAAFTHYHNLMARPLGLSSEGFCELARIRCHPPSRVSRQGRSSARG